MDFIKTLSGTPGAAKLLLLLLLVPLIGSLCVWGISLYGQTIPGNGWRDRRDAIIWTCCSLTLLGVLALRPYWGTEFILLASGGVGYSFGIDGLRYVLAALVSTLWLLSSLFSRWYLAQSSHKMRYYFFFLLGENGILCVLFSADLYTLLTGFVVLNLACWVLTGHRESEAARMAGTRALTGAVFGGLCALLGILLLTNLLGTVRFSALRVLGYTCQNRELLYLGGGLVLIGISISCAVWPLPKRMPSASFAPGPAAALIAGAVTVAWMFSAMVLSGLLFWWNYPWGIFLSVLGIAMAVIGAVAASFRPHLKQALTMLSVSQTGLILLTLGLNCLLADKNHLAAEAVVLQCLHHGLCQMVLFLCAGTICLHQSDLSLSALCGFGRGKKALFAGFALASASLCGMPFFFGSINLTLLQKALHSFISTLPAGGRDIQLFQLISWLVIFSCGASVAAVIKLLVFLFGKRNTDPALQARYDALNERDLSPLVQILLVCSGAVLLLAGLTAPYTLRHIAYNCVGFFSTLLRGPLTAFEKQPFVLAALYLGIGGILYLLFLCKPLKKLANGNSKPDESSC